MEKLRASSTILQGPRPVVGYMPPSQTLRRTGKKRGLHSEQNALWLFLVPSGLLLSCVLLFPLGYGFYLSLFDYDLGSGVANYVGLGNYTELLQEGRFWQSLGRTVMIVLSAVAIEFCLGLAVAYGLYRLTRGARLLSIMMFLPHIITPVVAALFLKWLFMGRWGLIDATLIGLNIFPPDWLGDAQWARVTVILADVWKSTPFMILVLYAGLNTIDQSHIEAAEIDGAGNWSLLFRVMLPQLRAIVVFVLAIRIMDSFRFFDTIYVLTGGGPGTATETITLYTYALAFRLLAIGKASALGVISLLVIAGMIAAMIALVHRGQEEARSE
ncbi:ABC transmembrane type-1 domain-containing protein [Hyphomicrobiales bacterium]|nr:ABC transmembrane type-1 domain-containing protein [Hyphomicrobiales bacterium]CAH1696556.1 ABC transmembrane type-1 domain-containing protein [Hyphomicrobiales bacterium]